MISFERALKQGRLTAVTPGTLQPTNPTVNYHTHMNKEELWNQIEKARSDESNSRPVPGGWHCSEITDLPFRAPATSASACPLSFKILSRNGRDGIHEIGAILFGGLLVANAPEPWSPYAAYRSLWKTLLYRAQLFTGQMALRFVGPKGKEGGCEPEVPFMLRRLAMRHPVSQKITDGSNLVPDEIGRAIFTNLMAEAFRSVPQSRLDQTDLFLASLRQAKNTWGSFGVQHLLLYAADPAEVLGRVTPRKNPPQKHQSEKIPPEEITISSGNKHPVLVAGMLDLIEQRLYGPSRGLGNYITAEPVNEECYKFFFSYHGYVPLYDRKEFPYGYKGVHIAPDRALFILIAPLNGPDLDALRHLAQRAAAMNITFPCLMAVTADILQADQNQLDETVAQLKELGIRLMVVSKTTSEIDVVNRTAIAASLP